MQKKLLTIALALTMAVTSMGAAELNVPSVSAEEAAVIPDTVIAEVPQFKNMYDFASYVDNADTGEYKHVIQENITKSWSGMGGVHTITAPEDGTLVFYTLTNEGYVNGVLYNDFALTSKMTAKGSTAHKSTRDEAGQCEVKKGTKYYFRQERWNGSGDITATTYIGIIPATPTASCITPVTKYDEAGNIEIKEFNSVAEFKTAAPSMTGVITYVKTTGSGNSEVYSFSVKSAGWLLTYAVSKLGYLDQYLFSDKTLSSFIAKTSQKNFEEEPNKIWVEPGTYYLYTHRWNGYSKSDTEDPQNNCLGFIPVTKFFTAEAPVLNADASAATVKFTTTAAGNIRVMQGLPMPSYVDSDKFWNTKDRANMIADNTFTATSNGDYVARFEDTATGMNYMIGFTVTGIVAKNAPGITTTGNNTGKAQVSVPGKVTVKAKNVKGKKIKITVKAVSGVAGYKVSYGTDKKFKKAKTKTFKGTSYTIKKLKKKKTYFIKVCAYNSAGAGKWSKTVKVKIKK